MPVYIDESVSPAVARGLQRRGIEAVDVREVGNVGMTDREQLDYIRQEDLPIFTHDDDFVRIVETPEEDHPGVIYCDQRKHSIGDIIRSLEALLEKISQEDLQNQVRYL